jgi:MYXO-CTERM domain-containing protein
MRRLLYITGASAVSALLLGSTALTSAQTADPGFSAGPPGTGVSARRPALLSGILSAPSAADPVAIARAYLATQPAPVRGVDLRMLEVEGVVLPAEGAVVSFRQVVRGVEVAFARVAVRIDGKGQVRWISAELAEVGPSFVTTPALSAEKAIAHVLAGPAQKYGNLSVPAENHTQLVIYAPPASTPRLAWLVALDRNMVYLETLRVFVDAETGAILSVENLVKTAKQANAFRFNPKTTPDQEVVTLDNLPDGAKTLDSPDVAGRNCIDKKTCQKFDLPPPYGTQWIHVCEMLPSAAADSNFDFLSYERPVKDTEPEDPFSEVQMYYHTTKAYAAFRTLANNPKLTLKSSPLTALANFRVPDFSNPLSAVCSGPSNPAAPDLGPFDNAAFMPKGSLGAQIGLEFPPTDMIVFAQGTSKDFAYDGDVVYHEFAHAMMHSVSKLGSGHPDKYGFDHTPAGMHEAYADYFSSIITGDPNVGEYAGDWQGAIRTLENTMHCPEDLWGEAHQDSNPYSGALWDVRKGLAEADRPKMDAAVYTVVSSSIGMFDGIPGAQQKTLAELEVVLGSAVADAAKAKFAARGIDTCNNRVIVMGETDVKDVLFLHGTNEVSVSLVPGPVQFQIEVKKQAKAIAVNIAGSDNDGSKVKLLVKKGEEPILWSWLSGNPSHDAEFEGAVTFETTGQKSAKGTVHGDFTPGKYHVMMANAASTVTVQQIAFASQAGEYVPDAGPTPTVDAGSAAPDASLVPGDADSSGCGCRVGGQSRPGQGALVSLGGLLVLGLLWPRRRR